MIYSMTTSTHADSYDCHHYWRVAYFSYQNWRSEEFVIAESISCRRVNSGCGSRKRADGVAAKNQELRIVIVAMHHLGRQFW